jgi:hypothetical protein
MSAATVTRSTRLIGEPEETEATLQTMSDGFMLINRQ